MRKIMPLLLTIAVLFGCFVVKEPASSAASTTTIPRLVVFEGFFST